MTRKSLSKRISEWLVGQMTRQQLNYEAMATATGLDATTISTIVRHGRDVRLSTFVTLCRALGQDPSMVIKGLIK